MLGCRPVTSTVDCSSLVAPTVNCRPVALAGESEAGTSVGRLVGTATVLAVQLLPVPQVSVPGVDPAVVRVAHVTAAEVWVRSVT